MSYGPRLMSVPTAVPENAALLVRGLAKRYGDVVAVDGLDLEVRPQSGAKVEQLVKEVYSYPPDVVKIATDAIRVGK